MNREKIAVIIPTYNRIEKVLAAVQSVLAQTYPVEEIFVIDDGSTKEIVEKIRNDLNNFGDLRIKFIESPPTRHPGMIRNIGVEKSNCEWLAFLDSDDTWHERKIELQISQMLLHESQASCTDISSTYNNGFIEKYHSGVISFAKLVDANIIVNSSVMVTRSLLTQVGLIADSYRLRGVEDYATWLRIASKEDWLFIHAPLVNYEEHSPDSIRLTNLKDNEMETTIAHLDLIMWKTGNFFGLAITKILKKTIAFVAKVI